MGASEPETLQVQGVKLKELNVIHVICIIYIYILVVVFLCYSYVLTGLISFDEVSTCRVARPEQGLQSVWTLREIKNNQDGGVPGKVLYNDLN